MGGGGCGGGVCFGEKMKEINKDCPCYDVDCPRHGCCEECQAYHREHGGQTSCGK